MKKVHAELCITYIYTNTEQDMGKGIIQTILHIFQFHFDKTLLYTKQ